MKTEKNRENLRERKFENKRKVFRRKEDQPNRVCGNCSSKVDNVNLDCKNKISRASLMPESTHIAKPAASWLDDFLVWMSPEAFGCCQKFVDGSYCPPDDQWNYTHKASRSHCSLFCKIRDFCGIMIHPSDFQFCLLVVLSMFGPPLRSVPIEREQELETSTLSHLTD
ncbi:NPC1-like intracellular cholesterol transporter 1 [Camellia lanceoleosa]|uniref:NPC1-like intracellular cholesterol transporter 1 n=1 Tax=Camellia lanceoleosa TaxID=1840588 RepID=A0ACC0FH27_9ERIC|nr:NPC1-like intracellular cholesterol transporter 1 [Camellia lanceoleosa]